MFYIDMPKPDGALGDDAGWQSAFATKTKEEAVAWIRENVGPCDDDGCVCLLTEGDGETYQEQFDRLAAEWEAGRGPRSNPRRLAEHEAYRAIVAMGPGVVPLVLTRMRAKPDWWFWALHEITGQDPGNPAHAGQLQALTADWLAWGVELGIIPEAP